MEHKRIWELDALRGVCILGVIIVHFLFDLTELYDILDWNYPDWFVFVRDWGGILFFLISGICATLGSRSVRRGVIVLGCGLLITAVTVGMYHLDLAGRSILIYFGVLHCLGICMILWPIFKKCHWSVLLLLAATLITLGFLIDDMTTDSKLLMPLGIVWEGFFSADYFPLLPYLGYFLLGSVLGRTVYSKKRSLLPNVKASRGILAFFRLCGRQSLPIYLLHQPILAGVCMVLDKIL